MSPFLNMKQYTVGQLTCSLRRYHSISRADEDTLYKSQDGKITTACNTCGIRVKVEMDSKHEPRYRISRLQKS